MTHDEALSVTEMILNNWTRPEWTDGQTETYIHSLREYDAEVAVQAVARAHLVVNYRPTFAEFVSFYRATKAEINYRNLPVVEEPPPTSRKLPPWVKEWFAARYAYHRFDRPQDMRRFPQQGDWADPDQPLMPPNEWAREAQALSDTEIKKGIASGGQRPPTRRQTQPATMGAPSRTPRPNRNGNPA